MQKIKTQSIWCSISCHLLKRRCKRSTFRAAIMLLIFRSCKTISVLENAGVTGITNYLIWIWYYALTFTLALANLVILKLVLHGLCNAAATRLITFFKRSNKKNVFATHAQTKNHGVKTEWQLHFTVNGFIGTLFYNTYINYCFSKDTY